LSKTSLYLQREQSPGSRGHNPKYDY